MRSDSGASGMMRATGSPLACRIRKVTRETPTHTATSRTSRRMIREVMVLGGRATGPPGPPRSGRPGGARAPLEWGRPRQTKARDWHWAKRRAPKAPRSAHDGRAAARLRRSRVSVLGAGVEQPEPLVSAGLVGDLAGDAQHVVLGPEEDGRRILL